MTDEMEIAIEALSDKLTQHKHALNGQYYFCLWEIPGWTSYNQETAFRHNVDKKLMMVRTRMVSPILSYYVGK